jgi:hypothetical protein
MSAIAVVFTYSLLKRSCYEGRAGYDREPDTWIA